MSSHNNNDEEGHGEVVAKDQGKEPAPRMKGPKLMYKLQLSNHDKNRAYPFSEASAHMMTYQRNILQLPSDSNSWFALYELQKVRQASPEFWINVGELSFGDLHDTVSEIERMLDLLGYGFQRRANFEEATELNLERIADDVGLMVSLLLAENEWETSIMAYRRGDKKHGEPVYLVVADPPHTPQTKSAPRTMRELIRETEEHEEELPFRRYRERPITKKLDFDDVEITPPTKRKSVNPVVESLIQMMEAGHMTMEELARVSAALAPTAVENKPKARVRYVEEDVVMQEQKKPGRRRGRLSVDDDVEFTAQDSSAWYSNDRPVTTVLQNLNIRTFDGSKISPEEARSWLSRFIHVANVSGWNNRQRLDMFVENVTTPVKHWWKQLQPEVKRDWKAMLAKFTAKYCTDSTPPRLTYYKLTQKSDELATNYLYRLNTAALRAGFDFRNDPEDLEDHLQQFFETLHDKTLQLQFRFTPFETIDKLEEKLTQYETAQIRPAKKAAQKKGGDDSLTDQVPTVNRVDTEQRSYTPAGGSRSSGGGGQRVSDDLRPVRPANQTQRPQQSTETATSQNNANGPRRTCEHCNKTGHSIDNCWQLMTCEHCGMNGHVLKNCRAFIEKMISLREKMKNGELQGAEAVEQLNC